MNKNGISNNKISKEIEVSSSTINRIIGGKSFSKYTGIDSQKPRTLSKENFQKKQY